MTNPILQMLNPQSNPMSMIQQFAQFKKEIQGKDPEKIVRDLMSSGKMSQQQFDQLKQQAQALQSILK